MPSDQAPFTPWSSDTQKLVGFRSNLGRRPNAWIVGLGDEDSDALLDELWAHVQRGLHMWTQEWRQGDLVIWDNRCTLHRRNRLDPSLPRLMHRTQVRDKARPTAFAAA
jgi:alpha-ketoglutarate-dependent taurine dioxygenase